MLSRWRRFGACSPALLLALAACAPAVFPLAPSPMTPTLAVGSHEPVSGPPTQEQRPLNPSVFPHDSALRPADGARVCRLSQIAVDLFPTDAMRKDGSFDPGSIRLALDGRDVTAALTIRANLTFPVSRVSLMYVPAAELTLGLHRVEFTYATAAGTATLAWSFSVADIPCE